jgi:hypothetical protein
MSPRFTMAWRKSSVEPGGSEHLAVCASRDVQPAPAVIVAPLSTTIQVPDGEPSAKTGHEDLHLGLSRLRVVVEGQLLETARA